MKREGGACPGMARHGEARFQMIKVRPRWRRVLSVPRVALGHFRVLGYRHPAAALRLAMILARKLPSERAAFGRGD